MARQNTFTIIPQGPSLDGNAAIPARPMTSKQVRKAYKASTKTPTMTRAERIKWEREEQERIKREYEKERAAAKARAAREKKKEKEMQQREEKRRNGLPLVNVRPSQDTIARFVRGNGSKKKRDAEGAVVPVANEAGLDERTEANNEDMTRLEAEPVALGSILEAEEELSDEEAPSLKENAISDVPPVLEAGNSRPERTAPGTCDKSVTKAKSDTQIPQYRGSLEGDYDVDLSLEESIDEAAFDSALDIVPEIERDKPPSAARAAVGMDILRARRQEPAKEFPSSQDLLDEDINTDMLEELDELLSGGKTPAKQRLAPESVSSQHTETPPAKKMKQQETPESMVMDKSPTSQPERRAAAGRRVQLASSSPAPPRQAPPTGTQAILVNFDAFFPTSSQQLRELEEERETSEPDIRTPTVHDAIGTAVGTTTMPAPRAKLDLELDEFESDFGSFPSTAHFSLLECSAAPIQKHQQCTSVVSVSAQPASKPEPPPAPPAHVPQPSRFFTSSGSREQLSLALQRSRRSAALEQIHEKERQRQEAGLLIRQSKYDEAASRRRPASSQNIENYSNSGSFAKATVADKENLQPEMKGSQETEYGGDWIEDAAWDLALC